MTYNRPEFLYRILNYYKNIKVDYPIVVCDASKKYYLEKNIKIIKSVSKNIDIVHHIYESSIYPYDAILRSMLKIKTKYHLWIAEDDFVNPSGIEKSVDFLEKNPSYVAAQGKQILFSTANDDIFSSDIIVRKLKMVNYSVEGESALDRIRSLMGKNTSFQFPKNEFSVKKTSNAIRISKEILSLGVNDSLAEAIRDKLTLLSGNTKLLDHIYIARQYHDSNGAEESFIRYAEIIYPTRTGKMYKPLVDKKIEQKKIVYPDYFDRIVDPLFSEQWDRISTCCANEIILQDKINFDEALEFVKYWEWYFMAKNMMPKFYAHGGSKYLPETAKVSLQKKIKEWAKEKPYIKKFWYRYSEGKMSLDSLLSTNSRYHNDFMPIYKAITVRPPDYKDHFDI